VTGPACEGAWCAFADADADAAAETGTDAELGDAVEALILRGDALASG